MYVEAICPLCFASHVVPDDMRGQKYRCEECEEVFVVSRKAKATSKKPPRPREVKPVEAVEALPETKLVDGQPKKTNKADDDVIDLPDDAVQGGAPALKTSPASKRRRDEDDDRPRKRRRQDDDEDDRPREQRSSGSGTAVGLIVGLGAAVVLVLGLCGGGFVLWFMAGSSDVKPQAQFQGKAAAPANNGPDQGAMKKADPPKQDQTKPAPPKQDPPRQDPPKQDPPRPDPPVVWTVKADPPPAPVKLPADFKKEIPAPGRLAQLVFPTSPSPFVAVGTNLLPADERQVWNLQTGQMIGKVSGAITASGNPILSPDGAYLAYLPTSKRGSADVWAVASGKMVNVSFGTNLAPDLFEFAGPGRLLVGRRNGATNHICRIYDAATGQQEREFPTVRPSGGNARDCAAVSPGGAYLALADRANLQVYDLKTGSLVGQRALPKAAGAALTCHGLSFSPDGRELAGLFVGSVAPQHLVCWDLVKGDVVSENTVPKDTPPGTALIAYRGHALDWIGDRRGWLVYGYTMVERGKKGTATFLPEPPPAPGGPVSRHLIGPEHIVTLVPTARVGESVLTVNRFDPDKPQ